MMFQLILILPLLLLVDWMLVLSTQILKKKMRQGDLGQDFSQKEKEEEEPSSILILVTLEESPSPLHKYLVFI